MHQLVDKLNLLVDKLKTEERTERQRERGEKTNKAARRKVQRVL